MCEKIGDGRDALERRTPLGKGQQLTRQMGRMLRCLSRLGEKRVQTAGIAWRLDLSETDVTGNDGKNVVQVVRNSSCQRA